MFTAAQTSTVARELSPEDLARRAIERRAVEAAIWGMPLVNFDAMRQAYFRNACASFNDVIYWSRPSSWKNQVTTPNASTNYVMFFVNLKDGPVVVEVPPVEEAALFGTLIDAWNTPVVDLGNAGEDQGRGGKYLLLPPGRESQCQDGYIPARFPTYNAYGLLRVIPKSGGTEHLAEAVAYLKKLRIYPLWAAESPPSSRFIDMADKNYEAIPRYDVGFYVSLARMVQEEPVRERDLAMMGQLHMLGIGKEADFRPNAPIERILRKAIAEAHAFMLDGFRNDGFVWWPRRKWRSPTTSEVIKSNATFLQIDRVMVDERSFIFYGAFGGSRNPPPNLYVKTFEDKDGATLDGSNRYRLSVPPNVPTTQFWAVAAYDNATAGFIRESPVVGLDSYNPNVTKNPDGSVDLYFGPKPPPGQETNWISTAIGRPFFLLFRNYAPHESVLARTSQWVLNDVERMK